MNHRRPLETISPLRGVTARFVSRNFTFPCSNNRTNFSPFAAADYVLPSRDQIIGQLLPA
jgi:hypothetical protein